MPKSQESANSNAQQVSIPVANDSISLDSQITSVAKVEPEPEMTVSQMKPIERANITAQQPQSIQKSEVSHHTPKVEGVLGGLKENAIAEKKIPEKVELDKISKQIESQVVVYQKQKEPAVVEKPQISSGNKELKVAEAIKVPEDFAFVKEPVVNQGPEVQRDEEKKEPEVNPISIIQPTQPITERRKVWMEMSGFGSEEEAIILWQKLFSTKHFIGKEAKLVVDKELKNTVIAYLRIGKFDNAGQVLDECKKVREIEKSAVCYAVHDIYG
jgi:hypothetical protein